MNEEKLALQREVMEFIKRSAPEGAIAWAKKTEPHKTNIAAAKEAVRAAPVPRRELRRYAGAFMRAFRAWFDEKYPDPLTPEVVKQLTIREIWHSGKRVTALQCSGASGPFSITPRKSSDPELAPSFSAAEMELLRVLPISRDIMVESGLIDDNGSLDGLMSSVMATKRIFPGALVTEVTDFMGDKHSILPRALQDA